MVFRTRGLAGRLPSIRGAGVWLREAVGVRVRLPVRRHVGLVWIIAGLVGRPRGDRTSRNGAEAGDSTRHVVGLLTGQNVTTRDQPSSSDMDTRGLLIRGFGVRVPGGALVIMALSWRFASDQSHIYVYCGWLWDLCGIYSLTPAILQARRDRQSATQRDGPLVGRMDGHA
jgi:hypothetical protein